jgi:chemotaxis signal transduction protein
MTISSIKMTESSASAAARILQDNNSFLVGIVVDNVAEIIYFSTFMRQRIDRHSHS